MNIRKTPGKVKLQNNKVVNLSTVLFCCQLKIYFHIVPIKPWYFMFQRKQSMIYHRESLNKGVFKISAHYVTSCTYEHFDVE